MRVLNDSTPVGNDSEEAFKNSVNFLVSISFHTLIVVEL